jgi:hypothetical protein
MRLRFTQAEDLTMTSNLPLMGGPGGDTGLRVPEAGKAPGGALAPKVLAAALGLALATAGFSAGVDAAPMVFTDRDAFENALAGLSGPISTIDFDDVDAATPIAEGVPFQGIEFTTGFGPGLVISDNFQTTSGLNALGLDDGFSNEFLSGDELLFGFVDPVQALGLSIVASPDDILAADFQLVGGGASVFNTIPPAFTFADGGQAFFLGIINSAPFDYAQLISFGDRTDPFFGFNVDDVTTVAVPVPTTAALLGIGLIWLRIGLRGHRHGTPAGA